MQYSHGDAELARQPAGYWTWATARSILSDIHASLAKAGMTQPQWWVLNQLVDPDGARTRAQMSEILATYLDPGARPIDESVDIVIALGWATEDSSGTLTLTAAGRLAFDTAKHVMDQVWAQRHDGIPDEAYVQALKVLQQFIHNTGGQAWHHAVGEANQPA
ncbi:MarR family transcriptional regulator [Streptomyces sp. MA15]|uniref:MarR family transcriptional regulator n=1 Tax=Streptomyces sp. MA15 TaxID=3055061 RepID=UPI0025B10A9D|nr:MarR family transcriptional regulator [Streptomyces sp. MA15]MDN3272399.1 MarR family transcriptional regulator [Streptomyces sp. MA15]